MNIPQYIIEIFKKNPRIGRNQLAETTGISNQLARMYCRIYKGQRFHKKNEHVLRGIALYDIHYPEHDEPCINIVLDFCKDFQPDYFLFMGDQMHMDCVSSYSEGKPKLLEGKRLEQEYRGFQQDILDRFNNVLKPSCKKYFFIGNHEYRIQRLLEKEPRLEGLIEVENKLQLDDYIVIPFNEPFKLGKMCFIHGIYWNIYHAAKNVREYNENLFSGHVHTSQIHTMNTPVTHDPRQGVSIGCLSNTNPEYKRNKPNNWVHQFLFFYLFEDGTFSYYTPVIVNGRVVINNKLYEG